MTKLSDLLRGAAERAPLGEASVSTATAARRVRLNRATRATGNGIAGLGAAALVVAGVVAPGGALAQSQADSAALNPEAAPAAPGGDIKYAGYESGADLRYAEWGYCGSFPLNDFGYGDTGLLSIAVDWEALGAEVDGGATVDLPYTVTVLSDFSGAPNGPAAVVLWNGMVVAMVNADQAGGAMAPGADYTSGDVVEAVASIPLVDCFEGNPLPGGKYEMVVSQSFVDAIVEPEPGPTPEPGLSPEPVPGDGSGTSAGSESTNPDATDSTLVDPNTTEISIDPMPTEPYFPTNRVVSEPYGFVVAGEPVEDAFAQYYPEPWAPPTMPDDILTPAGARELFESTATTDAWDMAAGTSRWFLPNYGDTPDGAQTFARVEPTYYGCAWDGTTGRSFPDRSSASPLLRVSGDLPSRVGVSYGWVVDDNPRVALTVTNVSGHSLPGFYGEPNRALYLVKDGRVVAEIYPANVDPYSQGGIVTLEDGKVGADGDASAQEAASYWGILDDGASLSGNYLWRDVNGCWTETGPSRIASGTYTVLTMQSLGLQQWGDGTGVAVDQGFGGVETRPAIEPGTATDLTQPEIDYPAPGPVQEDWLEVQVWSSLGSVTITTH